MDLPILYENDDLLVIDKPSGLIVHADGKREEYSVAAWMLNRYPQSATVGEPIKLSDSSLLMRPGIVHRLDRETSGVLLLAKTQEAFLALKQQFQARSIEKQYNAFVSGVPSARQGTIDRMIGRSSSDFRRWSAQRGARGQLRSAVTDYAVVEDNGAYSFLAVRPHTGRTHQIRVHLKAINCPIVCDRLYDPNHPPALGFSRLALHAHTLAFDLLDGSRKQIEAPLPPDFQAALVMLRSVAQA